MTTLLLRYSAPLMAFGHSGRFDDRPTGATPTVSAIQGMVAAAAGIDRDRPWPAWIADLHLAIRIDRPGRHIEDYHTVNPPPRNRYLGLSDEDRDTVAVLATAERTAKDTTVVSRRGYIADATFLVAIDDPTGRIADALAAPTWHLYAGRKACPLTEPLVLGTTDRTPETALEQTPTVGSGAGPSKLLDAVVFTEQTRGVRVEDRNDRAAGFRDHRRQRRWHTTVEVPTVESWFDVHDDIAGAAV